MKKKLLAVIPTIMLVATPLAMGASTVDAAPKANSQKIVAKAETRPTLRIGSHSSYVKNLQKNLKDVKYDTGVDGVFGPKTQTMVKQFQADHNLISDGIVGPATWAALDQNKVERQQFTVNNAIAFGQKKLGNNIVFSGDGRLVKDSKKQSYYRSKAANKDWMNQGGSGTIGWFHIYKDGRVIEE
ncbi:peptidoglycan-binding domain-containing protein [Priestia megaterium]|jgi:peptidoglycan hydrolase-like protein with peptidoglycan-binding domain|uniref:peptidoglycan-binding domain-containing protein n=1 Tax=Priestia megaterium TaxID=1404 RepID=UPI00285DF7FF|nr:peptidoglycan-binding domain-containing protein [Priestia megaterium]MDR7246523.1 peptidoglycan hydrolase-like protein with peptidoglycan-binding domain [Priestia megaterium]